MSALLLRWQHISSPSTQILPMFDDTMPPVVISSSETRVQTPDGQLHVKRWQPQREAGRAPLVLMHDCPGQRGSVARIPRTTGRGHRA